MTPPNEVAAPLDALLVDAAFGPLRRLAPDLSTAKLAARLATRPEPVLARLRDLVAELARVGAGSSDLAPDPKDRRFTDPAWASSPVLRRIVQAYLAASGTVDGLIADAELFELIQYGPQTPTVREVPLLLIPPTINKFYVLDLAPGRSWIEYLVRSGQQVFTLSWRNPDARHARHGLDSYVRAVLDALDA